MPGRPRGRGRHLAAGQAGAARRSGRDAASRLSPDCSSPGSRPAAAPLRRSARRRLQSPRQPPAKWRRGGAGRGRGAAEPPAPEPACGPPRSPPPPPALRPPAGQRPPPPIRDTRDACRASDPAAPRGALCAPRVTFHLFISPAWKSPLSRAFLSHLLLGTNLECGALAGVSPSQYSLFTLPDIESCHRSAKIIRQFAGHWVQWAGLFKTIAPFLQLGVRSSNLTERKSSVRQTR